MGSPPLVMAVDTGERPRRWFDVSGKPLPLSPGIGICHQVNLEYLARVVVTREGRGGVMDQIDGRVPVKSGLEAEP